jgi:hypothetical protein
MNYPPLPQNDAISFPIVFEPPKNPALCLKRERQNPFALTVTNEPPLSFESNERFHHFSPPRR